MASLIIASPPSSSLCSQFLNRPSSRLSFAHSESLSSSSLPSLSISPSSSPSPLLSVYCGRGDKKTAKGKRFNHSYGNARPKDKKKGRGPPRLFAPPAPAKKDKFEDNEIVKIEIDESLFNG